MTVGLLDKIADWFEKNSKPCFYKENFNFDCLGCGIQRAFIELLRGNIWESVKYYPALIPLILLVTVLLLHLKLRLKNGAKIILALFFFECSFNNW